MKTFLPGVLLFLLAAGLQAQPSYDVRGIMNVIRHPKKDATVIVAHRGYFGKNVAENSLTAIDAAVRAGIEAVELDVKLSADGLPVMMHDYTLGRTTTLGMRDNRKVSSLDLYIIRGLRLVSPNGTVTNDNVPSLVDVLDHVVENNLNVVVLLDLKDAASTVACWKVIKEYSNAKGVPAYQWVILKCKQAFYETPKAFETSLGLTSSTISWPRYMPVYNTYCVDYPVSPLDHYNSFKKRPYFVGSEIESKQEYGLLENLMNQAVTDGHTTCGFQPIPDHSVKDGTFFNNDGTCCYTLPEKFYHSKCCGYDTEDDRGSLDFLENFDDMIITDKPLVAVNYFKAKGQRNTAYYYSTAAITAVEADTLNVASTAALMDVNTSPNTASTDMNVYPNPTRDFVYVHLNQKNTGVVKIDIADMSGKLLFTQEQTVYSGTQDIRLSIKRKITVPGLYLVSVSQMDQPRRTFKIMVN